MPQFHHFADGKHYDSAYYHAYKDGYAEHDCRIGDFFNGVVAGKPEKSSIRRIIHIIHKARLWLGTSEVCTASATARAPAPSGGVAASSMHEIIPAMVETFFYSFNDGRVKSSDGLSVRVAALRRCNVIS